METHKYSDGFFDYIDDGARASARQFISLIGPLISPASVLDLGSGRGVWLDEWMKSGVTDVVGIDGNYVDTNNLSIPVEKYMAADLTKPQQLGRFFDFAQSLEVGEHLPKETSAIFVRSLTQHSNRILFSAAVPGQGGEYHINEQPLEFWRQLFKSEGFMPFDYIRPKVSHLSDVKPWYRYNTILYLNDAGMNDMPDEILATRIADGQVVQHRGNFGWQIRKAVVSLLPQTVVTQIASHIAGYRNKMNSQPKFR